MAEQENIHQGWLYTREGEKFAPMTLIDDVYAMNGNKYKDEVTKQINNVTSSQSTALITINQTLGEHTTAIDALENADKEILAKLTNFGDDGDDSLYIVDKNNNVIAYIDGLGVHSVDFTMPNENGFSLKDFINNDYKTFVNTTNTSLTTLSEKLANFGDDGGDAFYIVDQHNNVIAYFDETGANSTNFTTPSGNLNQVISDLGQEIETREKLAGDVKTNATAISSLSQNVDERLANFDGGNSDSLYIIDSKDNVMAYIDETGLHSLNVYSKNFNLEDTNERIRVIEDVTIPAVESAYKTADSALKKWVDEERLKNFNGDDTSVLYIIDSVGNVIAYVDELGVRSLDVRSKSYSMETDILALYTNLAKESADRAAADKALESGYKTDDTTITNNFNEKLKNFDGTDSSVLYILDGQSNVIAYIDATGVHSLDFFASTTDGVNTTLSTVYKSLVQETQDRMAADKALEDAYKTADSTIRSDFAAADKVVSDAFKAADTKLSEDLTAAYEAADAKLSSDLTAAYKAADADLKSAYETADSSLSANISANAAQINAIKNSLSNFNLENSDAIYIIDSQNNVIAYFDEQGLTTINLTLSKNGETVVRDSRVHGIYNTNSELKTYSFKIT